MRDKVPGGSTAILTLVPMRKDKSMIRCDSTTNGHLSK